MLLSQLRHHEFRQYSSNHILKVYEGPNQSVVKNTVEILCRVAQNTVVPKGVRVFCNC